MKLFKKTTNFCLKSRPATFTLNKLLVETNCYYTDEMAQQYFFNFKTIQQVKMTQRQLLTPEYNA